MTECATAQQGRSFGYSHLVATEMKSGGAARIRVRTWLFVSALLVPCIVHAECVQTLHGDVYCGAGRCLIDKHGKVFCSRYFEGGAQKTIHGKVLCGKGDCAKDINGTIICSSEIGGAVFLDAKGYVHCYGVCEAATVAHCEAVPADEVENEESLDAKERQQEDQ